VTCTNVPFCHCDGHVTGTVTCDAPRSRGARDRIRVGSGRVGFAMTDPRETQTSETYLDAVMDSRDELDRLYNPQPSSEDPNSTGPSGGGHERERYLDVRTIELGRRRLQELRAVIAANQSKRAGR
jgi:hypothetical protein